MSSSGQPFQWNRLGLVFLFLLLIPVEVMCANAAFETLGEIDSAIYWAVLIVGNVIALAVSFRFIVPATIIAVGLGAAIIPYQIVLIQRHTIVQAEAASIVAYAYSTKISTGSFPKDLTDYQYNNSDARPYIQGYHSLPKHGGFQVVYRIGTESTSHWYSPNDGWSYYPD